MQTNKLALTAICRFYRPGKEVFLDKSPCPMIRAIQALEPLIQRHDLTGVAHQRRQVHSLGYCRPPFPIAREHICY